MLGLLEDKDALPEINSVHSDNNLVTIGKLFAQAKCDGSNLEKNLDDLFKIGKITYKAGEARSLRYLEVGELLSFIEDDNFYNHIAQLESLTEETYQREALTVSKMRFELLFRAQP